MSQDGTYVEHIDSSHFLGQRDVLNMGKGHFKIKNDFKFKSLFFICLKTF